MDVKNVTGVIEKIIEVRQPLEDCRLSVRDLGHGSESNEEWDLAVEDR